MIMIMYYAMSYYLLMYYYVPSDLGHCIRVGFSREEGWPEPARPEPSRATASQPNVIVYTIVWYST